MLTLVYFTIPSYILLYRSMLNSFADETQAKKMQEDRRLAKEVRNMTFTLIIYILFLSLNNTCVIIVVFIV